MPIKKRKSVPKEPAHPVRVPSDMVSAAPENLVPLERVLKQHDQAASDAVWDGDEEAAEFHEEQAAAIRQRIAEGEVWEVQH